MEARSILELAIDAPYKKKFVIGTICSDDDSVMRAHLQHVSNHRDGKLPTWIREPEFFADPTHRIKVVAHFYALATAPVRVSRVTKDIAKNLKKSWGYMIRQNRHLTNVEEFVDAAKACVEHMFNNHQHCNISWCNALKAEKEGKVYVRPQGWLSSDDARGKKMYDDLKGVSDKYGSAHYLHQSMHEFDTQTNESLNQSQACLTPKSMVFHESWAFHHRHAITVGTHNWGFFRYHTECFGVLGVTNSESLNTHLKRVEKKRKRWKEWHSSREVKRRRKYKQDATQRQLLYEQNTTEYASGVGLDIGAPAAETREVTTRSKRKKREFCMHCKKTDHLTKKSRLCYFNKNNVAARRKEEAERNTSNNTAESSGVTVDAVDI